MKEKMARRNGIVRTQPQTRGKSTKMHFKVGKFKRKIMTGQKGEWQAALSAEILKDKRMPL